MDEKTKYFSQIFDTGVKSGVIAQIDERVLILLIALLPFMDNEGRCSPSEKLISKILGIAPWTISQRIRLAKRTLYRDEPVLEVYQKKELIKGKWEFSNNQYKISRHIRNDLISRFTPVGRKPHTEEVKAVSTKTDFPDVGFPLTENTPTNDKSSLYINAINENRYPSSTDRPFKEIRLDDFEAIANDNDKSYLLEIARWLGEKSMNFILKAYRDPKCGMIGIESAYGKVKEEFPKGKVKHKGKLFNYFIRQYKQDH